MSMDYETLKQKVLDASKECVARGRGYSQEKSVLDEVESKFDGKMHRPLEDDLQEAIITCWHDLFREGTLCWGLNLDNPGPPFFHFPKRSGPLNKP